ncbi:aminodeoxychorismate synthase component I [Pinirhizobacter sp.]|uniref:aminodeoxychorismate synthase component I n=1 Tax=Pinirhizobacter sp. TaxID=2950432 RepID=UPI002F40270B
MAHVTRHLAGRRDLLALAAARPARYPGLLDSAVRGTAQARYDLLFAFPQGELCLGRDGIVRDGERVLTRGFLDALDEAWHDQHTGPRSDGLPFTGGWMVFLGYELAREVEPSLWLPAEPGNLPIAMALRCPAAIIIDHELDQTILVAESRYAALIDEMAADLEQAENAEPWAPLPAPLSIDEDEAARFLDGVARIHEHLAAGDIFQVNLSRQWRARFAEPLPPAQLAAALRAANPAPFAGMLQWREWAIVSSSPERLVSSRDGVVQVRPIAGTRPRHADDDDARMVQELHAHPKERAEHVMLIDLERNDLGRVCEPGSVQVDELMTVESYAHVHHIVSNVRGRLREGVTPGQVIAATFPGGTITGCPKVRCMQIIASIEGVGRGAYTGSMGYLDRDGSMDLNILIRTMTLEGTRLSLRAGAGIVADSDPQRELAETRAKARGMLRALGDLS